MPKASRLQFPGAYYHAYHRGNRRESIFYDDQDYVRFEAILIEAMRWSGIHLYTWKLMPNHFHLVLETPEGNLAEFMQRLLSRYVKYFNGRHNWLTKAEDLGAIVESLGGPDRETLASDSRQADLNGWRQAVAYVGRRFYRFSVLEIGAF